MYRVEATSPMFGSGARELSFHDPRMLHESTDSVDHQYADLQEISNKQQAGEHNASRPSGGQSKVEGYELTQCLAYGTVGHK